MDPQQGQTLLVVLYEKLERNKQANDAAIERAVQAMQAQEDVIQEIFRGVAEEGLDEEFARGDVNDARDIIRNLDTALLPLIEAGQRIDQQMEDAVTQFHVIGDAVRGAVEAAAGLIAEEAANEALEDLAGLFAAPRRAAPVFQGRAARRAAPVFQGDPLDGVAGLFAENSTVPQMAARRPAPAFQAARPARRQAPIFERQAAAVNPFQQTTQRILRDEDLAAAAGRFRRGGATRRPAPVFERGGVTQRPVRTLEGTLAERGVRSRGGRKGRAPGVRTKRYALGLAPANRGALSATQRATLTGLLKGNSTARGWNMDVAKRNKGHVLAASQGTLSRLQAMPASQRRSWDVVGIDDGTKAARRRFGLNKNQ